MSGLEETGMENQGKVKLWLNTLEKSKLIFLFIHIAVFIYFLVLNIYTPLQGTISFMDMYTEPMRSFLQSGILYNQ